MNPMGEMRRSTDSGVRGVDDVNATEILDALRVHWKGAALVPELCIDDEHELALVDVWRMPMSEAEYQSNPRGQR